MSTVISIEALLDAKEGANCQFKEAKNRFSVDEAAQICCALSNGGGGMLVLGISDKRPRQVVGSCAFEQPERTRRTLCDKLKVPIDFHLLDDDGKRVLVFEVMRHSLGSPTQVEGIAWWYEGDSLIPLPERIRRSIYAEGNADFSAEICSKAVWEDLDTTAIELFRHALIHKSGNRRFANETLKRLLEDCGVVSAEGITYAALILFAKENSLHRLLSPAEVIFEYRQEEVSGPASQREDFHGGVFTYHNRLWELINLRNTRFHYQDGLFVYDIPAFNERVVREAILNAICHRDYQLRGSVYVRQYQTKLIIESPGGFPLGITLDNILDRTVPRNKLLAEMFARCGLVERSGQGMNLIYEINIREGKSLPDFTGTDDYLVRIALCGLDIDKQMLNVVSGIGEERLQSFSTDDFLVINTLYHNGQLSNSLRNSRDKLIELGIVEHVGRTKYILARSLYAAIGKTGVYTRRRGLDCETNKQLLLKHIRTNGSRGTKFSELAQVLPALSRSQISSLLKSLRKDGKIRSEGKTSASHWFVQDQPSTSET